MINLQITRRRIGLPRGVQALVSNALTRAALESRAKAKLAEHTAIDLPDGMVIQTATLDWMMVKYSEQVVFNARREIQHWFAYSSGAHLEPGYAPLYYVRQRRDRPSPNKSAVAAIGEGIAGFLAQRLYGCTKLARPNHDHPDIVMESNAVTYLVEAKATITGTPQSLIDANLLPFVSNTATASYLDVRPLRGLLVATAIESEQSYRCEYVEVEIIP